MLSKAVCKSSCLLQLQLTSRLQVASCEKQKCVPNTPKYVDSDGDLSLDLVDAHSDNNYNYTSPENTLVFQPLTTEVWAEHKLQRFFQMKPADNATEDGVFIIDEAQSQDKAVEVQKELVEKGSG